MSDGVAANDAVMTIHARRLAAWYYRMRLGFLSDGLEALKNSRRDLKRLDVFPKHLLDITHGLLDHWHDVSCIPHNERPATHLD